MQPEEIAERVWPGAVEQLEPLGGGITNRNFKVTTTDGTFVLRVGGKDTELLGIDRRNEYESTCAAAELGIAPEVVAFVEPEGYLVTRFVEGQPTGVEEVPVAEIATSLRRFHDHATIPGRFDSFRVVESYREIAAARGVDPPAEFAGAKALADRIERARGEQPPAACHNDLLNANFIGDGGRLWLVDWEYAGMGDRFFDLANFSINHELDDSANEQLLRAYFGETRDADVRSLRLMRFMSDFREAMWGVVQQAISELDFDFVSYAAEHFARLERTAQDSSFQAALEA